jgi:2-polyprenyl-3-methyl-5-hydroxy-6-metoxy-1,4-benzoquinol methylase
MSIGAYDRYADWKNWISSEFMRYDAHDAAYFSGELRGLDLEGLLVLELGFGNGKFLAFARDKGAIVAGTELLPEAIRQASAAGLRVYRPDLTDAVLESPGCYDLVIAFDVLEHLTHEEIQALFAQLARLLRPAGLVIARFPNCASPLGCVSQNGDLTHRSSLSASLLMQLLLGRPWRLTFAGNPFRVNIGGNPFRRLALVVRHALRDGIQRALNIIYGINVTLDPNVTVRIEHIPVKD